MKIIPLVCQIIAPPRAHKYTGYALLHTYQSGMNFIQKLSAHAIEFHASKLRAKYITYITVPMYAVFEDRLSIFVEFMICQDYLDNINII